MRHQSVAVTYSKATIRSNDKTKTIHWKVPDMCCFNLRLMLPTNEVCELAVQA